jgi:hypothetical protein
MALNGDTGGDDSGFPHTKYYDPGIVHGGGDGHTSAGPSGPSVADSALSDVADLSPVGLGINLFHSLFGSSAYDEVESAMKQANPAGLRSKARTWNTVATKASGYSSSLQSAISDIAGAWEGDDATQALTILRGLNATLASQSTNAANMSSALDNMGQNLQSVKDSYGHGEGTMSSIGNFFTGSDDRGAAQAYQNLMQTFQSDLGIVPKTVPTEVKTDGSATAPRVDAPPTHAGVNGAPSTGGAGSAPHMADATPTHIAQPTLHNPHAPHQDPAGPPARTPGTPPPSHTPTDPPVSTPPGANPPGGIPPYTGGGGGIGAPGSGNPGLDTGGSLAGFDPSGAGGLGGLGAGAGGFGAGDAGGLGAAGLGGLGAGLGAGAGGLGAGAGGLGAGAGGLAAGAGGLGAAGLGAGAGAGGLAEEAGAGAAAGEGTVGAVGSAGGRGAMMPMRGGAGSDEDERERSTWLSEDDDVWGAGDDVPGLIS